MPGDLPSPGEMFSEMADFRPTAFAVSVRTCAHSTVRAGDLHPFPFSPPPDLIRPLRRAATCPMKPYSVLFLLYSKRRKSQWPAA